MSFLQRAWEFISGSARNTSQVRSQVKAEFVALMSVAPLLHCNLGAMISEHILCTDASEKAGSIELSTGLTAEGRDFLGATEMAAAGRSSTMTGILLVSLFNGIGGGLLCEDGPELP